METILSPRQRMVTAALRVMGLSEERQFQNYHRVLNRARWSSLRVSRILLHLVVAAFVPAGAWCCWQPMKRWSGGAASTFGRRHTSVTRQASSNRRRLVQPTRLSLQQLLAWYVARCDL